MRTSEEDTHGIWSTERGARHKRKRDKRIIMCAEYVLSILNAQYIEVNVGHWLYYMMTTDRYYYYYYYFFSAHKRTY